jgi:transposase InsO family protein
MPWGEQNLMNRRTEFAVKALKTDNFSALCREYGISREVGYKWRERFVAEGLRGMGDKSRRPHRSPEKLGEEVICRIVRLKERHRHWGPRKLREIYQRQHQSAPSESSFKRVLNQCGLTEKRVRRRAQEQGRLASGRQAKACNEVWTVDFKGWWYDRNGRCEPLTVRDEYSRYVLELRAVADARTKTVQTCFERLFERYGLPEAIRSDNGAPFASNQGLLGLSRLSAWWLAQGIDLERSRPGCPQDNGSHERMHRDVAEQLEGVEHEERQAAFDTWRREFNEERPHESLGMRMPKEVYMASKRNWKAVEQLDYPSMASRRVLAHGGIKYEGQRIFISNAIAGWDVGLKANAQGGRDVYFCKLLLGTLEMETAAFQPVTMQLESSQ